MTTAGLKGFSVTGSCLYPQEVRNLNQKRSETERGFFEKLEATPTGHISHIHTHTHTRSLTHAHTAGTDIVKNVNEL